MKLPKGMVRKPGRRSYYYRRKVRQAERAVVGKKEVWVPLGRDYKSACVQLQALKNGKPAVPSPKTTGHQRLMSVKQEKAALPASAPAVVGARPAGLTVAELAGQWLELYVESERNERGQRLAKVRVDRYLVPALGEVEAAAVRLRDLAQYRRWLKSLMVLPEKRAVVRVRQKVVQSAAGLPRAIAKQTVVHVLADCRCVFLWAVAAGLLDRSPVPRKKWLLRMPERLPDRLSPEEVAALLKLKEPHGYVIRLGLESGLRWGELIRAEREDVQDGFLSVDGEDSKSGKVRRVPIPEELVVGRVGRLVPFESASSFAKTVRRLSKVQRFHVHMLRHTFGCRWLERGGSLAALQEVLGHASVVTTQRYARLGEDAVRTEWGRMGGRLFA